MSGLLVVIDGERQPAHWLQEFCLRKQWELCSWDDLKKLFPPLAASSRHSEPTVNEADEWNQKVDGITKTFFAKLDESPKRTVFHGMDGLLYGLRIEAVALSLAYAFVSQRPLRIGEASEVVRSHLKEVRARILKCALSRVSRDRTLYLSRVPMALRGARLERFWQDLARGPDSVAEP